jgi:hypothetical protein
MKKFLTLLGIATMAFHGAPALITVPKTFPTEGMNGNTATQKDQLSLLISRYQNDVVLLVNSPESYSEAIQNTKAAPATVDKLKALATSSGPLTLDSLASAVTALARQNPADAPAIVASALALLNDVPGGLSPENRESIGRAAINGLPENSGNQSRLVAIITGVTLKGVQQSLAPEVLKSLRDAAIAKASGTEAQAALALSVDEALVAEGIVSAYAASPEFLAFADNFATDQLEETNFSGDQGVITQGAVFSPGSAGSAGGQGSSGNQVPTPTPAPPAS